MKQRAGVISGFVLAACAAASAQEDAPELGLPIACALGSACFVQQYPDMDKGSGAADSFCGTATYDGHKGTDIRIRYMGEIAGDVAVVASAAGTVLRQRDGEPDKLVSSDADRAAVKDKECGNGVVVDHGGGWETQYCHMKQGSIAVKEGQAVKAGDVLGAVGASGLAQFPHVHIGVRKDGADIDPNSGRPLTGGCVADPKDAAPLWDGDVAKAMAGPATQLVDAGFAGAPVDNAALAVTRPEDATAGAQAMVGWALLINLRKGDRIVIVLNGPSGGVLARQTLPPLDRSKATYSLYAGKRGAPAPGEYALSVEVLRDGKAVLSEMREASIQ